MDGEQNPTIFHAVFVTFRFVLGNSHSDQGSGDTAYRTSYTNSGQRRNVRESGERSHRSNHRGM